jgi:hypothetical protein
VGHELPEERPHGRDMGVGLIGDVDAEVARSAGTPERVQRSLIDRERGQVVEQRAVASAGAGCVDAPGCQAVIPGQAYGVLRHSCQG